MKPIKRKYKPTIVCDKCHKSIGKTKPSYKKVGEIELILSILVDTFISKISLPMQPVPEIGSISVA